MNKETKLCANKLTKIVANIPSITKAVIVGHATEDSFLFEEDLILAIFSKEGVSAATVFGEVTKGLYHNNLYRIDVYPMADPDFYCDVSNLIDEGEVIFER